MECVRCYHSSLCTDEDDDIVAAAAAVTAAVTLELPVRLHIHDRGTSMSM